MSAPGSRKAVATGGCQCGAVRYAFYVPLENAHPRLRALLYWHAAEELEHKAVAYDVLQAVDPRYRTRVIGLAIATSMLATMWFLSGLWFLRQDGFGPRALIRQLRELRRMRQPEPVLTRVFARGIRDFRRGRRVSNARHGEHRGSANQERKAD